MRRCGVEEPLFYAENGDLGGVELVDKGNDSLPTVTFFRTGYATVVEEDQVEFIWAPHEWTVKEV